MPSRRNKPAGIVTYFVVTRDEETGERQHYEGFTDLKDAESAKRQQAERPDQPGQVSVVTIETLPTTTFPEMYKPKS
jgi:hypothetical protein